MFEHILKFAFTELPLILRKILNLKEGEWLKVLANKKLEILVKVYVINIYRFTKSLTEDDIILFVYKCLPSIITFANPFPVAAHSSHLTPGPGRALSLSLSLSLFLSHSLSLEYCMGACSAASERNPIAWSVGAA